MLGKKYLCKIVKLCKIVHELCTFLTQQLEGSCVLQWCVFLNRCLTVYEHLVVKGWQRAHSYGYWILEITGGHNRFWVFFWIYVIHLLNAISKRKPLYTKRGKKSHLVFFIKIYKRTNAITVGSFGNSFFLWLQKPNW